MNHVFIMVKTGVGENMETWPNFNRKNSAESQLFTVRSFDESSKNGRRIRALSFDYLFLRVESNSTMNGLYHVFTTRV